MLYSISFLYYLLSTIVENDMLETIGVFAFAGLPRLTYM